MDIKERISDAQGKAATLQNLGYLKANTGQIEEAIALYQQSLEITERIGYAQGKAMTLWWLGHIAEQQGDSATPLNYLQQSLEILQRVQSPDAETVRQIIARLQQQTDDRDNRQGMPYPSKSRGLFGRVLNRIFRWDG